MGIFGTPMGAWQMAGQQLQQPLPQQQKKPGFGDPGGLGEKLGMAGAIFSAHAGKRNPMGDLLMQQQMMRARQQQAEQNAMRERQWGNEDWMARAQWERNNPKPVNNDTVQDYNFISQKLGPDAGNTYLRNRADPPQYRQGPDGQFYRVSPQQTPTAPVGKLTPLGNGGPASAPGGFRRSF